MGEVVALHSVHVDRVRVHQLYERLIELGYRDSSSTWELACKLAELRLS